VLHLVPVSNVTWHAQYFGATLCQVVPRAFEFFGITGTEDQSTAGSRELSGHCQAQSPRAAGNQHYLSTDVLLAPALQRLVPEPSKTGERQ
jgi:hypothetical protein